MKFTLLSLGMACLVSSFSQSVGEKLRSIPESKLTLNPANFEKILLPRFGCEAAKLWNKKRKITKQIWKEIVMGDSYDGRPISPRIEAAYKEKFRSLFKKEFIKTFGDQEVPENFLNIKHPDNVQRLELMAQKYGDGAYCVNKVFSFFAGWRVSNAAFGAWKK